MCNFHGYDNARNRRHERRRAKKVAYDYNKALNMALKAALNQNKPSQHQTTPNTKGPVLSLKRKVINRVEKAISIRPTEVYDAFDNCCLPKVALYSVKTKSRHPILTSGDVTARF